MTNYDAKEEKVIGKITKTIEKLDTNLTNIDNTVSAGKEHSIKCWYEEKKAIHDIKKILHEIDKYEKYDEKELDAFAKEMDKLS